MERYAKATLLQISSLLTSEISRLTFFLVTNSADSHRTKGMGIQSGRSTNCEQWSHAVKEGATDGTWGAVLPLTRRKPKEQVKCSRKKDNQCQ